MKRSTDRIRTTHTGSLPRAKEIFELMKAEASGMPFDPVQYEESLSRQVTEIVRRQVECGIDVVNDGECGKPSFNNYVAQRIAGFEARIPAGGIAAPTGPIGIDGRDARAFPDYYQNVLEHNPFANIIRFAPRVCVGPVSYIGRDKVMRDIRNLKAALAAAGADEGFLPAASPVPVMNNEYYATEEAYFIAYGNAMREEYTAILDAGLLLQIDDPRL